MTINDSTDEIKIVDKGNYFDIEFPVDKNYMIIETWNDEDELLIFSIPEEMKIDESLNGLYFSNQIGKRTEKGLYKINILLNNNLVKSVEYTISENSYENWHDEFMRVFLEADFECDPKDNPLTKGELKKKEDVFLARDRTGVKIEGPLFQGKSYFVPDVNMSREK